MKSSVRIFSTPFIGTKLEYFYQINNFTFSQLWIEQTKINYLL